MYKYLLIQQHEKKLMSFLLVNDLEMKLFLFSFVIVQLSIMVKNSFRKKIYICANSLSAYCIEKVDYKTSKEREKKRKKVGEKNSSLHTSLANIHSLFH